MYIGIDLGTSGVKLLLLTSDGKVLKTVSKSYDLLIPQPLWSEQNPDDWYRQTMNGLKEIVSGNEDNIKAISFSGQMHGLVLLDKNDKVIRNALLWNDQRTIKEVSYLTEVIGNDKLLEETGNVALTGLTAPKILWVYNNEKENFNKIDKVMLPKDYLIYKLSKIFATDVSDASGTLYFNPAKKDYSDFMLDILHLRKEQLPKIYESFAVVGVLTDEVKNILNISNEVKVIAGGGDQAVGAVGVGVVDDGKCNISLGTSGVVFTAMEKFQRDRDLQSYAHANGNYHMMGVMLNASGSLKWWIEGINGEENYNEVFEKILKTNVEDELFFLPYLTGERAPINDPTAKGLFIGLRVEHRRSALDRAVVEGVSFNLKTIFETIKSKKINVDTVRITGGGAKNAIWAQMLADILNVKIETIEIEEGPALGAAILAMVGNKEYETVSKACKQIIKTKDFYSPNKNLVSIYQKKYEKYIKIYPSVKILFTT